MYALQKRGTATRNLPVKYRKLCLQVKSSSLSSLISFQFNKQTENLTLSHIFLLHSFGRPSVAQSETY